MGLYSRISRPSISRDKQGGEQKHSRILKLQNLGLTPGNLAILLVLFAMLGREPAQVAAAEVLSLISVSTWAVGAFTSAWFNARGRGREDCGTRNSTSKRTRQDRDGDLPGSEDEEYGTAEGTRYNKTTKHDEHDNSVMGGGQHPQENKNTTKQNKRPRLEWDDRTTARRARKNHTRAKQRLGEGEQRFLGRTCLYSHMMGDCPVTWCGMVQGA